MFDGEHQQAHKYLSVRIEEKSALCACKSLAGI